MSRRAAFPSTSSTPNRWNKCLMASSSSLPVLLAWALASFLSWITVCLCQPPRDSTGRGMKLSPSLSQASGVTRSRDGQVQPVNQKGADHSDIKCCVPASCPVGYQDVSWPSTGTREECILFLPWGQVGGCSHLVDGIPKLVMPGYSLTM